MISHRKIKTKYLASQKSLTFNEVVGRLWLRRLEGFYPFWSTFEAHYFWETLMICFDQDCSAISQKMTISSLPEFVQVCLRIPSLGRLLCCVRLSKG
jgi:hypothetical protein